MSRLRLVPLLIIALALLVPTGASAKTSKFCRLVSPAAVGKGIRQRGISMDTSIIRVPTVTSGQRHITVCDYRFGTAGIAESSVLPLKSNSAAKKELRSQVSARRQQLGTSRKLKGPWSVGYVLGGKELYLVKGHYLFRLAYSAGTPSTRALRDLGTRAAHKL
jgi:hypothetical protein